MKTKDKDIALLDYETAMMLWDRYSFEYSIILDKYTLYLRIKKELGIRPVNRLSKIELRDFPEIEFLGIPRRVYAEDYLLDLTPHEIKDLISQINNEYVDSALLQNLRTRISDYRRQIDQSTITYDGYYCDPGGCSSGSHTHQKKALTSSKFK